MPLDLIKKIAVKILGPNDKQKSGETKRAAPAPARPAGKRGAAASDKRGAGRKRAKARGPDSGAATATRGGTKPSRPTRSAKNKRTPEHRKVEKVAQSKVPNLVVGRPAVKPQSARTRPGGAVAQTEVDKHLQEHAAWDPQSYVVKPQEGKKRFHDFSLPTELMHAVADLGFEYCTPIQALSLEHALAGKNVAGKAQTGTGKTAAFLVAIIAHYLNTPKQRQESGGTPRALVIAPTRELVIQICKDAANIGKYCNLRSLAVYGGMDYEQQKREVLSAPVDLLVATPGRLLDFVRSRVVDLSKVDTLVIDEADRMLDMGFIPDVRSIVSRLPTKEKRCTMLYSATLDDTVMRLASQWMQEPVMVEVESEGVTTKSVKQIVYVVTSSEKFTVLYNLIQQYPDSRTLIFCNRRGTTEAVAQRLLQYGIRCEMLSGDVSQNRRLRVLEDFRAGKVRTVVATDVAGRGLHVDDIGFVINFDFPYEPEDYVHRIGRTGRAGHTGTAISFADEDESFIIPEIEKFIGEELKCTILSASDPLMVKLPAPKGGGGRTSQESTERKGAKPAASTARRGGEKRGKGAARERGAGQTPPRGREQGRPKGKATPERTVAAVAPVVAAPPVKAPESVGKPTPPPQAAPAVVPPSGAARRVSRFSEEWVPGE